MCHLNVVTQAWAAVWVLGPFGLTSRCFSFSFTSSYTPSCLSLHYQTDKNDKLCSANNSLLTKFKRLWSEIILLCVYAEKKLEYWTIIIILFSKLSNISLILQYWSELFHTLCTFQSSHLLCINYIKCFHVTAKKQKQLVSEVFLSGQCLSSTCYQSSYRLVSQHHKSLPSFLSCST